MREALVGLCASLLSCNRDALAMRDEKRRVKRTWILTAVISVVAAVIIGILMWSNLQIDRKNEELQNQIDERKLRESELLTQRSMEALSDGDQHGAIRDAYDALAGFGTDRPYYAPAEQALFSALDMFDPSSNNLILRDTVLELTSPVESMCVNADCTQLTTIDNYGNLSCFEIASGTLIWTQNIDPVWTSELCLYRCGLYDSIIVLCRNAIVSLSQETGEVLWKIYNENFPDRMELSEDGSYAFCLLADECFGAPVLVKISMLDGSFASTTPLSDEYASGYAYHTDNYDFSSDGRYFVGCYDDYTDIDNEKVVVFLLDTITGGVRLLRRFKSESYLYPYSVEFTDRDKNLVIVQYADNYPFTYRAEKVRISDGAVLWKTDTPKEAFQYYMLVTKYLDCLFFDDHLLLGAQKMMYVLDMDTGEIKDTVYMDSKLIRMEQLGNDTFSMVREDGAYITGYFTEDGLTLHEHVSYLYDPIPVMDLVDVWDVYMINGGYLRVGGGTNLRPVMIGTEHDLPCCVAIVPEDNQCSVIIRQAVPFDPVLEVKELYTYYAENGEMLSAEICGADTLVLRDYDDYYGPQYMLYDRTTLEPKNFILDESIKIVGVIEDGTKILGSDGEGFTGIYDITSSEAVLISQIDGETDTTDAENLSEDTVLGRCTVSLARDHTSAEVILAEEGLLVWLNDQRMPDIEFPMDVSADLPDDQMHLVMDVDENGYVQLCFIDYDRECICEMFYVFSIWDQKWYSFPVPENSAGSHLNCVGASGQIFTVMNSNSEVRSYDLLTGEEVRKFNAGIRPSALSEMRWIMDDRYLALLTHDLQIFILDGVTGEVVFTHTATMINNATFDEYALIYEPQYATDPSGKRLYIWDREGICVDTEHWVKLVDIPHMLMYDPASDMVLMFESFGIAKDQPKHVTAVRIPTTGELLSIAETYLGE